MQVCTLIQTDNHASNPPLSFFTGRMPILPPNQQHQSTEGIKSNVQLKVTAHINNILVQCFTIVVIHSWNESYLPFLPSYRASLHFTVLISRPIEGGRLSWPGWLGYMPRRFVLPNIVGTYPSINQARRTVKLSILLQT